MTALKKQDDLSVAVQLNGEPFISSDNGILFEEIGDDSVLLYIKSAKDEKVNIKIKIHKKK